MRQHTSETRQQVIVFLTIFLLVIGILLAGVGLVVYRSIPVDEVAGNTPEAAPVTPTDTAPVKAAALARPAPPSEGFVGSAACTDCHAEIAEKYRTHSMANALGLVSEHDGVEDYTQTEVAPPGPRRYRIEQRGDQVFHHEVMLDQAGQPIYDQAVEVKYRLGSGKRGRAYLTFDHGLFFQSSIGWYSEGKKWDLSPGYRPQQHQRFSRRVGEGCFYCHSGRSALDPEADDHYLDPPFRELGIGCENCHGPGQDHVALREKGDLPPGVEDPIVNPARLSHAASEAVCYQCHLQGEYVSLRYGRQHRDFRPGQTLEDIWVVFVSGDRVDAQGHTRAVSQVEQMRASRCYQESAGKMGCTSCHDPHAEPPEADVASFYREKCNNCHANAGCSLPEDQRRAVSADDSCIQCHMPRIEAHDVPHTAQTDHRVLRRPETAAFSQQAASGGLQVQVFDNADQRLPQREIDRAKALAMLRQRVVAEDPRLLELVQQLLAPTADQRSKRSEVAALEILGDDMVALDAMGRSFQMQSQPLLANACWQQILKIRPNSEQALFWLLANNHQVGLMDEALAYLERAIALNPLDPILHGRKAHMLGQAGQMPLAIKSAEKALELDPTLTHVREWLVDAYRTTKQEENRQEELRLIQRIKAVTSAEE